MQAHMTHVSQERAPQVNQPTPPAQTPTPQPNQTEAAPPAANEAPKSDNPLDNLPEAQPEPTVESPKVDPQQTQAKEHAISRYKRESEEWQKVKPEYETLKAKVAELEGRSVIPPEIETELTELRAIAAVTDIQKVPAWQEKVGVPYKKQTETLAQVAEFSKIALERIEKAVEIQNPLMRKMALKNLLAESEVDNASDGLSLLEQAANDRHLTWKAWGDMEKEALNVKAEFDGRRNEATKRQEAERIAAFTKSSETVFGKISASALGEFTKDAALAERMRTAAFPTDAQDQAYSVQAGILLPMAAKQIVALRNELAALKRQQAGIDAARPNLGNNGTVPVNTTPPAPTLKDAMGAMGFPTHNMAG